MKYNFYLKEPNADKETLIYFFCYFKEENKRFSYSTGEFIHPKQWKTEDKFLFSAGKNRSKDYESIKMQLDRYSNLMQQTENTRKMASEPFTSEVLKKAFDIEFKKVAKGSNLFFEVYDLFTAEKSNKSEWSAGTKKRYKNIRNMLEKFETEKNYKLTFAKINNKFHLAFKDYCLEDLEHINNTYLRNLVFFKTFMNWSIKNKHTYNTAFRNFNINDSGKAIIKESTTSQIALTIEDLNKLMQHEFKTKKLEHTRDIFVLQCVTGMRYGELSLINSSNITENEIMLKEEKGVFKEPRNIPLTTLSKYILLKYDYDLQLITNQKQNEYIKDVFEEMEYTAKIEKAQNRGRDVVRSEAFFYDRISTHTARRTFITMMKRMGKSDKLIASATGHKDIATLNKYYQVDTEQTKEAMQEVFNIEIPLKKVL
jgi:integrase